ncbi:TraB/GumN family protein [Gracilibacillus oryzae]|uniref:TraB/GumN family protein n=1 Tax=Gracilibacillus oryzae TaxID=1672701 RepID=A0A7C8GVU1_9BACI|nr:TraB/GumN family protein [Gracilibacillus oryzae]KAB8139388.1 TraB/GumN family protein [Gracilibacillus oryzae]
MNKWKKGMLASIAASAMMLSTVIPVLGAEQQTPDISPWAVGELNEGEKYGIYPTEWYYDNFRSEISQDRLEDILTQTSEKIADIDIEKSVNYEPITIDGTTREDVLNGLFNIVAPYDLPAESSPVEYFQERQIVVGNGNSLALERPATTQEAVLFAKRLVKDTYDQLDAGAKGVAWKVENDGNVVYLLGSIHVGTPELYPFDSELVSAFEESDSLYVEVNLLNTEDLQYFNEASMYQDGTTIKDAVSEETYDKLEKALEKYGLSADAVQNLKPWSLASTLSNLSLSESLDMSAQEMANSGIDMYFMTNALLAQKPIEELEGVKFQADLFDGLSAEAQEEYLVQTLDSILSPNPEYNETDMINDWFTYWKEGNVDSFAESFNASAEEPSEFNDMLLGQRDIDMADKIAGLLESDQQATSFVVVGAGHYIGDTSVIHYLEQDGYNVESFYQ